jgi:hypothetical protein
MSNERDKTKKPLSGENGFVKLLFDIYQYHSHLIRGITTTTNKTTASMVLIIFIISIMCCTKI